MTGFAQTAAAGPLLLALGVCVLAGLVSFASPCVVPLVPGYLSYLAAVVGVDDLDPATGRVAVKAQRLRVAGSALLFVAGFTVVFVLGTVAALVIYHGGNAIARWRKTGADVVSVPYKGNGQSMTDLAAGQIAIAFSDMAAAGPHVARGAGYGYGPDGVTLLATPLYSNTTLVVFFPTIAFGGTVVLMAKFDAAQYLALAQAHRMTHTMLVPVQYQRLLACPTFDTTDLSRLQNKFCTSAPFSGHSARSSPSGKSSSSFGGPGSTVGEAAISCPSPSAPPPGRLHPASPHTSTNTSTHRKDFIAHLPPNSGTLHPPCIYYQSFSRKFNRFFCDLFRGNQRSPLASGINACF